MESGCEARKRPWWVAAFLLLALLVPAVPATAAPGETGKYYILGSPAGRRDYLYDIALQTMGNGNRFREIIQLNKGRKQPDGATFTDGVEVAPGWVLMLPADAAGPGVRSGPLPRIGGPPSSPPPRPSPTPSVTPSTAPPSPTAEATTAAAATEPPIAAEPPAGGGFDLSAYTPYLFRGLAGVLAVVLAALALLVLRRGAEKRRPVPVEDGPWPPERHHTPTPAELAAQAAPSQAMQTAPVQAAVDEQPVPVGRASYYPVRPDPEPSGGKPFVQEPLPPAPSQPEQFEAQQFEPEPSVATPLDWSPDLPRPGLPRAGELPYVEADLDSETGPIRVRLAGVTDDPESTAYAWLGRDEPIPAATVPLILGHAGPWWLHVDLGRAPDVFTLVGALEDCRRLAITFARQLHSDGVAVAVVGDALGEIDGLARLARFPEPGQEPPGRSVIIAASLPEDGLAGVLRLVGATGGHCVPMLIGEVPKGRWSVRVDAVAGAEPPGPEAGQGPFLEDEVSREPVKPVRGRRRTYVRRTGMNAGRS